MNDQIVEYLTRLKNIYLTIDEKLFQREIKSLEKIIKDLHETKQITTPLTRQKKNSFKANQTFLIERNYSELSGTKLNYEEFLNEDAIVTYFDKNSKTKILKELTVLDLKLLYSLLTEDPNEIKGTKAEVFDAIKRNIRARKRGAAFIKTIK